MSHKMHHLPIVLLLVFSCGYGQSPVEPRLDEAASVKINSLSIAVDPRIELLSIVQYLSDYGSRFKGLVAGFDQTYRSEVDSWFSKFKSHQAIQMFNSMSSRGFSYDAPPAAMLYMNSDFSIEPAISASPGLQIWNRAGGKMNMMLFAGALKAFAAESGFVRFYKDHKPFYEQITRETAKSVQDKDIIGQLEQYYGEKRSSYAAIISPLLGGGSFGPQIERTGGTKDIYCIMGPYRVQNGNPQFGSFDFFNQLQRHEFSHSFVNPLADKYKALVEKYSGLFSPLEAVMREQAYSNWGTVLNESVVRAVTTRLAYQFDGPAAGDRELEHNKSRGFVFTAALSKKLEEYEKHRDKYPTLDSYYVQLLAVLDGITASSTAEMLSAYRDSKKESGGNLTVNESIREANTLVYELPDEEGRDNTVRYIDQIHGRFFGRLGMIDVTGSEDSELNSKLKGSIIVYTIIGSRLFKAAAGPLNISIDGGALNWNGLSEPIAGLRMIFVGKNPYGKGKAIVYAASSNQRLDGINSCFHGPYSYHIFRGSKLVKEGFYSDTLISNIP
jgi:hypothetical protein